MRNRLGEDIAGINTSAEGIVLPAADGFQIYTVDFRVQVPYLHPGNYYFSLAVANGTHLDNVICDWIDNAILLSVKQRLPVYGYMRFDCQIELVHVSSNHSLV